MNRRSSRVVPATGFAPFLPWYDSLVALFTRESVFKTRVVDQIRNMFAKELGCGHTGSGVEVGSERMRRLRIVDVGCGSGTLASKITDSIPNCQVIGIDADPRMLEQAKRKLQQCDRVDFLVGTAIDLPLPDHSADLVVCTLVLHHLTADEKVECLSEIRRVLVAGGTLLLSDYCRPRSWIAAIQFLPARFIDGWHRTRCNVAGRIPELLRSTGFATLQPPTITDTPLGTLRSYTVSATGSGK